MGFFVGGEAVEDQSGEDEKNKRNGRLDHQQGKTHPRYSTSRPHRRRRRSVLMKTLLFIVTTSRMIAERFQCYLKTLSVFFGAHSPLQLFTTFRGQNMPHDLAKEFVVLFAI